jgi:hypothetical protein
MRFVHRQTQRCPQEKMQRADQHQQDPDIQGSGSE